MIHAYNDIYLDDAMESLGSALEYAVLVAHIDGQEFIDMFIASGISAEFGKGNVKYISGMSGIELCRLVLSSCGFDVPKQTEIGYNDYPAEYWIGWILAYYQWHTGKSFNTLCKKLKFEDLYNLYGVLHEADPSKSVCVFDGIMSEKGESNLAILRKNKGLTQEELAKLAGVSVRSIQLFEQKQNDIGRAKYHHLSAIAKVLGCNIDDMLE